MSVLMWIAVIVVIIIILVIMVFLRANSIRKNAGSEKDFHARNRDQAEARVDEMLRALSIQYGGYVVHDVFLEEKEGVSSELDHVYICKAGIFLLETKGEAAVIKGQALDPEWRGRANEGEKPVTNPILQNQAHVERLRNLWGEGIPKIYPISVFPYGNVTLVSELAFDLKGAEEYMRAILAHSLYNEEEVEGFIEHFKQIVEEHGITREAHYENVRNRQTTETK